MGYLLGGIRQLGGVGTRHVAQRLIGKVGNRFARAGLNWGLNALGEFSEETIQSALDPVLRNWLLDENNEIKLYDEEYLYEGLPWRAHVRSVGRGRVPAEPARAGFWRGRDGKREGGSADRARAADGR